MKVIFLDIDGVVNCATTTQRHRGFIGIDPYMAFLVGKLVMETDAKVVLSSSWRHSPDGIEEVERQVCKVYDITPSLGFIRGDEIKLWLEEHKGEVDRYAIIDDNSDMRKGQLPNFFKTQWEVGITPDICERVKQHLLQ